MQDKCLQNKRKAIDGILGHQFNKNSSLLLHAIHSHFYWRILKKSYSSLVLRIITNKSEKKENPSLSIYSIL
jgi:hypothetical protein